MFEELPSDPDRYFFFRIYQAYMALNDVDAAAESFKKALQLEPNDG